MEQKIILSGMGGQGIISLGNLIGTGSMFENKHVAVVPSYGAEMRGGMSNCFVTISDKEIGSPVFPNANVGILLYQPSVEKFGKSIDHDGIIIYDKNMVTRKISRNGVELIGVPANIKAVQFGNIQVANVILAGVWCKIKHIVNYDSIIKAIQEIFAKKAKQIIDLNKKAFDFGYNFIK